MEKSEELVERDDDILLYWTCSNGFGVYCVRVSMEMKIGSDAERSIAFLVIWIEIGMNGLV